MAWSSNATGAPKIAITPSPVNSTVPPYWRTTAAERSTSSVTISRHRSISTAAARSIECTTSANSTVTCLYSARVSDSTTGEPQPWQNRAFARGSVPHERQAVAAVIAPPAAHEPTPRHHDSGRLAFHHSDPRAPPHRVTAGQTCLSYRPAVGLRRGALTPMGPHMNGHIEADRRGFHVEACAVADAARRCVR